MSSSFIAPQKRERLPIHAKQHPFLLSRNVQVSTFGCFGASLEPSIFYNIAWS
uniref:Uncharacterized protein n=1 Tax=Setaria italica TaxID=4555 RepID=K3Y0U2_SETIT